MNIKKLLLAVAVAFVGSGLLVSGLIASEESSEEMAEVSRYPQTLGSGGERVRLRNFPRRALEKAEQEAPQGRQTGALYRGRSTGRTAARGRTIARRGASRTTTRTMPKREGEEPTLNSLVPSEQEALDAMTAKLKKEGDDSKKANLFVVALTATDLALNSLIGNADSSNNEEWAVVETNFATMYKDWDSYQPRTRRALGFTEKTREPKHRRYDRAEAMKKIAELGQRIAKAMQNGENAAASFQSFVSAWEARQDDISFGAEMGYGHAKAVRAYELFAKAHPMAAEAEEEE